MSTDQDRPAVRAAIIVRNMSDGTIIQIIVVLASVLISITLHEMMHAFTSHWLGDDTAQMHGRLTLNPLAHIDPFLTVLMPVTLALIGAPPIGAAKPVPFNPSRVKWGEYGAALVGLAGPLTNLVLAIIAGLWVRFVIGYEGLPTDVLLTFMVVNLSFFVFNMIPFPPLDGSRALFAVAPEPLRDLMASIERTGIMGFMLFFFLLYPFLGTVIGATVETLGAWILGISLL